MYAVPSTPQNLTNLAVSPTRDLSIIKNTIKTNPFSQDLRKETRVATSGSVPNSSSIENGKLGAYFKGKEGRLSNDSGAAVMKVPVDDNKSNSAAVSPIQTSSASDRINHNGSFKDMKYRLNGLYIMIL